MKNILLMIFSIGLAANVFAQSVSGKVTDSDGMELPGVSILIKGTSTGTTTGIDGSYTISASSEDVLVFSFVGFETQEVAVGNRSTINVTLATDVKTLQEVVVIGYGEVDREDATGAISSVSSEDFNGGVITSPEQLFQGKAAGVQITSTSGEPGSGVNIRIRGTSSIRSNNNPLYVVDGVPLSGGNVSSGYGGPMGSMSAKNPLNFLNPNDIASIDILKDASATAIYGSRGANGVVLITTKKGKGGKGMLEYSYNLGISKVSNTYDLLSADEFVDAWSSYNPGVNPSTIDFGFDNDWQKEVFRTAYTSNHNLSFGDSSEKGSFRASIGYQDQQGVIQKSGLQRTTARFNSERKFMDDKLKITAQMTFSAIENQNVLVTNNSGFEGDLMGAVIKFNPTAPKYVDGSGNPTNTKGSDTSPFQLSNTEPSPIAILEYFDSYTNTYRSLSNIAAEYQITDELTFRTSYGIDRSVSLRKDAFSSDLVFGGVTDLGRLYVQENDIDNRTWENYFTYTKGFGDVDFVGMAGYSYQSFKSFFGGFQMAGFRTNNTDWMINNYASLDVENGGIAPLNSSLNLDELQSFFTRLNFDIKDNYIVTATLRADGSTRFGGNNRYGYFPSGAFKWRLGNESFMPESLEDMSLRVGYGITGNQEYGTNLYTTRKRYSGSGLDNGGGTSNGSYQDIAFSNPDLKWETTKQFNIGLDFGLIEGKLSGSVDFYNKVTSDMLFRLSSAQPAPQDFNWVNLDAEIENTGLELALNYVAMDKEDMSLEINGNVSYNTNMVHADPGFLVNTGQIDGQGLTGAYAQRIADGQPLYAFFLREFIGFSDDGTVQLYEGGDVQKFVGASPLPKVTGGLTSTFTYGDFSASVFFAGQFGHYIYSNTANAYFTAGSIGGGRNVVKSVIGNGEARTNAPDVATRFLEKGDFVRFQNANLTYNVPITSDVISGLRLFVTGQNLAVFTNYSGQDPEVDVDKNLGGVPSAGIDYTTYPRARTFTLGLNVSF